jgi:hypothetical protein
VVTCKNKIKIDFSKIKNSCHVEVSHAATLPGRVGLAPVARPTLSLLVFSCFFLFSLSLILLPSLSFFEIKLIYRGNS